jgi:hypothetical protein
LAASDEQRRQRVTWLFSFAPHLGQRRFFSCIVNRVRGRVFMGRRLQINK